MMVVRAAFIGDAIGQIVVIGLLGQVTGHRREQP
jgi:hypothetical protein